MKIIYLDTGETAEIAAADTEYIKTLGLIDGNIIYGRARKTEISALYPMYRIEIVNGSLETIKDYENPE